MRCISHTMSGRQRLQLPAAAARLALLLLLAWQPAAQEDVQQTQRWAEDNKDAASHAAPASTPPASSFAEHPAELVRVVFSSHLDVGYTGSELSLRCTGTGGADRRA